MLAKCWPVCIIIGLILATAKLFPRDDKKFEESMGEIKGNLSSKFVSIKVKLAQCYLKSYQYENAQGILERLYTYDLPVLTRTNVTCLLVRSYITKGWFKIAKEYLAYLVSEEFKYRVKLHLILEMKRI